MKFIFSIFFISLIILSAKAQDWQTITSMNEVTDLAVSSQTIWASTTGGIFSYQIESEDIKQYTNIQGLKSVLLNTIAADDHGHIITGGEEGILEIFDTSSREWQQLYDLVEGAPIRDIYYANDSLWVASGKGVAAFFWNGSEYVFNDYFINFNMLPNQVSAVSIYANRVWLGTDIGLLSAPADLSRYVINNPDLWTEYGASDSLPSAEINALTVYNNELYIGTPAGLSRVDNIGGIHLVHNWQKNEAGNYLAIHNLCTSANALFISSNQNLYHYSHAGSVRLKTLTKFINGLAADNQGIVWAATAGSGLYKDGWTSAKKLDGPAENLFFNVLKSSDEKIWVLSGNSTGYTEQGHYVYDDTSWKSYMFSGSNWTYLYASVAIYEDRFQNVWIGTWGGGLMAYTKEELPVFFHNYTYPYGNMYVTSHTSIDTVSLQDATVHEGFFSGVVESAGYEVITAIKEDRNGRIWFANFWAANDNYLAVAPYTADGFVSTEKSDWVYFGLSDGIANAPNSRGYISCIEFDDFGRVWIGTLRSGVYILDMNNTLTNKNDDQVYHRDMQDNLYSAKIYSIASDHDGIIWIGTAGGLNSFDGVNIYKHVGDPKGETGPLENRINQIYVDKYNNKWFATPGGLSILRAGYSPWEENAWQGFSSENSGLLDCDVFSVFVDPTSSQALVGTKRGLSVYSGTFAEIQDDFAQIAAGPNPFILNENAGVFTITNLQNNSSVKIFTINGTLVRELRADLFFNSNSPTLDGSRAYWDGRDLNGNTVNSGIYLYAAYTVEGQSVSGKIAVIRK